MVGAFVLGGIGLFALGLVLLAGSRLFSNDLEYVLYFDGSVSGLSIGAPVVFRGVPMGSVTQISLVANSRDSNVTIPVHIRIDEKSIVRAGGRGISEAFQQEIVRRMVQRPARPPATAKPDHRPIPHRAGFPPGHPGQFPLLHAGSGNSHHSLAH